MEAPVQTSAPVQAEASGKGEMPTQSDIFGKSATPAQDQASTEKKASAKPTLTADQLYGNVPIKPASKKTTQNKTAQEKEEE